MQPKRYIHQYDLPIQFVREAKFIAIDTEALGLNYHRDRLCLVQLCIDNSELHIIQFPTATYKAPNLKKFLKIIII